MKVNGRKERNMERGLISMKMVFNLKDCLLWEGNMEKECLSFPMEQKC